jgi:hypothetical protein
MPARPDEESQKAIDESWERALSPVNRFNHQALLDLLVGTQCYEVGVDKLTFRSEKKFSGGTAVMEISYDRLAPQKDRFEVTVLDPKGKEVRRESYDRNTVDTTYHDLYVECERLRKMKEQGVATKEDVQKLAGYEARWAVIQQAFPQAKEDRQNGQNRQEGTRKK